MSRVNLWMARSGRWRGPYTVKRRSVAMRIFRLSVAAASHASSAARLLAAYGLTGLTAGSSSRNGTRAALPYTDELDATTSRSTPAARAASRTFTVPTALTCM